MVLIRAGFGPVREVRRPRAQPEWGPIFYIQYVYISGLEYSRKKIGPSRPEPLGPARKQRCSQHSRACTPTREAAASFSPITASFPRSPLRFQNSEQRRSGSGQRHIARPNPEPGRVCRSNQQGFGGEIKVVNRKVSHRSIFSYFWANFSRWSHTVDLWKP